MGFRTYKRWLVLLILYVGQKAVHSWCPPPPPAPQHGHYREGFGSRGHKRVTYMCDRGYFLAGPAKRKLSFQSYELSCSARNRWYSAVGRTYRHVSCIADDRCYHRPAVPENGGLDGSCCNHDDEMTYHCDASHQLVGAHAVRCDRGRWNDSAPICTDRSVCSRPSPTSQLVMSYPRTGQLFVTGDEIVFRCKEGYYFEKKEFTPLYDYGEYYNIDLNEGYIEYDVTTRSIKCLADGAWNASLPECYEFTCPTPAPITNGRTEVSQNRHKHGDFVSYSCRQGYMLTGSSSRRCDMSAGDWAGDEPKCQVIRCPTPVPPRHGLLDGRPDRQGDVVSFSCRDGYNLTGPQQLTCMEFGDWSDTPPTCQPLIPASGCSVPVIPMGGKIRGESYRMNDVVTYECDNSLRMQGPRELRCTLDGWFPKHPPRCRSPLSYDDPRQLAEKLTQVFTKIESEANQIVEDDRGRALDISSDTSVDITFLVDSSGSIKKEEFKSAIEFVKQLAKAVGVSTSKTGVRIGVLTFAGDPSENFGETNGFHTQPLKSLEQVIERLDALEYDSSTGGTNLNGALKFFMEDMLTINLAARPEAKQYLFVLSDGIYNTGGKPGPTAETLKKGSRYAAPVEIFSIKIGVEEVAKVADGKKTPFDTLRDMSSEEEMNKHGDDPHMFTLENYSSLDYLVQEIVRRKIDYTPCGTSGNTGLSSGHIIGGSEARPGAWPWMAAILGASSGAADDTEFKQFCGGTLINSEWVLTAAHCLEEKGGKKSRFRIKLGSNDARPGQNDGRVMSVRSMHIHQGWSKDNETQNNDFTDDIALLRLQASIVPSSSIRTICLPNATSIENTALYADGSNAVVSGWGFAENRTVSEKEYGTLSETSDSLRQVVLPVVMKGQQGCTNVPDTVLCAGSPNRVVDACKGDSGGPLMISKQKDADTGEHTWYQIGIVSNGYGCALGQGVGYGQYTEVSQYIKWIEDTIRSVETADN